MLSSNLSEAFSLRRVTNSTVTLNSRSLCTTSFGISLTCDAMNDFRISSQEPNKILNCVETSGNVNGVCYFRSEADRSFNTLKISLSNNFQKFFMFETSE